jgi:hypothetical protein
MASTTRAGHPSIQRRPRELPCGMLERLLPVEVSIWLNPSSVRLNREQVQLVNLHRAIFARVDRAKGLLQREFLEHRHRENL